MYEQEIEELLGKIGYSVEIPIKVSTWFQKWLSTSFRNINTYMSVNMILLF